MEKLRVCDKRRLKMRAKISKSGIRLIAEEATPTGNLPVEIFTEMEKDQFRGLCGRTFRAIDYCNRPSSKKGTRKGTLELYLEEVKEDVS